MALKSFSLELVCRKELLVRLREEVEDSLGCGGWRKDVRLEFKLRDVRFLNEVIEELVAFVVVQVQVAAASSRYEFQENNEAENGNDGCR